MLFESTRVRLRKMTKEDTELYHKWRNDMKVYLEIVNGMISFIWVYCKMNTLKSK